MKILIAPSGFKESLDAPPVGSSNPSKFQGQSASVSVNDGGAGMATALGARFMDKRWLSILQRPITLDEAMSEAADLVRIGTAQAIRIVDVGRRVQGLRFVSGSS